MRVEMLMLLPPSSFFPEMHSPSFGSCEHILRGGDQGLGYFDIGVDPATIIFAKQHNIGSFVSQVRCTISPHHLSSSTLPTTRPCDTASMPILRARPRISQDKFINPSPRPVCQCCLQADCHWCQAFLIRSS